MNPWEVAAWLVVAILAMLTILVFFIVIYGIKSMLAPEEPEYEEEQPSSGYIQIDLDQ
jgi:phage shock protein PspC (stress-responsive transcriptional regulator)